MNVETVDIRQNQAASQTILDMEILDGAEGLVLMIDYAASRYEESSIETFKDTYVRIAQSLVTQTSQKDITFKEIIDKAEDKLSFFVRIVSRFRRKK